MNASGTGAGYREWSNLACLVTTALIYPAVLVLALQSPTPGRLLGLLIGGVCVQVVALVAAQILAAMVIKPEPDDERTASIQERSSRVGGAVLGVGVFMVIGLAIYQGMAYPPEGDLLASPVVTGYALFAAALLAELVRMSLVAIGFRRG